LLLSGVGPSTATPAVSYNRAAAVAAASKDWRLAPGYLGQLEILFPTMTTANGGASEKDGLATSSALLVPTSIWCASIMEKKKSVLLHC